MVNLDDESARSLMAQDLRTWSDTRLRSAIRDAIEAISEYRVTIAICREHLENLRHEQERRNG
jgi:hypothetical protein